MTNQQIAEFVKEQREIASVHTFCVSTKRYTKALDIIEMQARQLKAVMDGLNFGCQDCPEFKHPCDNDKCIRNSIKARLDAIAAEVDEKK